MNLDEIIRKYLMALLLIPIVLVGYYTLLKNNGEAIMLGVTITPFYVYIVLGILAFVCYKTFKYIELLEHHLQFRQNQQKPPVPQNQQNYQPVQPNVQPQFIPNPLYRPQPAIPPQPVPMPTEEELFNFPDNEPFPSPTK